MPPVYDDDAIQAAADLVVTRAGGRSFEVGYLHEGVPTEEAGWYAEAIYRGARVIEQDHRGPVEAADALCRRLLAGARCRCGKLVSLSDSGAFAYEKVNMADGSVWTAEEARAAGQCRWRRIGPRWEPGCRPNRWQRRRKKKR